jgi:hypothetical protein
VESTIIVPLPKNSPEPDILPIYPPSDGPLNAELLAWQQGRHGDHIFTQTIELQRPWLESPSTIELAAEYRFTRNDATVSIQAGIDGHLIPLDEPVLLEPVTIDKPWGREIWFTGMEARGESTVLCEQGRMPLSSYLALAPERICRRRPIVLLKILDPSSEPVTGDLYFEVHEEKREVYVVTNVASESWPQGKGEIRFGMNQERRAEFADDDAFRSAYLKAVKDYETVRRSIDQGEVVDPELETSKRRAMEAFTSVRPLVVGEVLAVPTWVPHSLQHGVRVVEFQTPTYERFIVSFAQRVLTQEHWDSDHAIANLNLDIPDDPALTEVAPGIKQIVAFKDFSVWRIELAPGTACQPPLSMPYAVCMNVSGGVNVGQLPLDPEQACFVPHAALPFSFSNASDETSISLLAAANW